MQRKQIVLPAALCGAAAGALATRPYLNLPKIPAFAPDAELLAHRQYLLAAGGWVIFSLYWEIAARGAAAAKSAESRGSRGVHVFLANLALLLEIAPVHGLGRFSPPTPLITAAGLAIEALGLFLAITARRYLGQYWSGEITIKVDHQLIRSGPYTKVRHPIYTGLLAMYAGTALVVGTWLAVIGFAIAVVAYWRKIKLEENQLNIAFGPAYDVYRRETSALLPGLF